MYEQINSKNSIRYLKYIHVRFDLGRVNTKVALTTSGVKVLLPNNTQFVIIIDMNPNI
jgi:hypothetical protein